MKQGAPSGNEVGVEPTATAGRSELEANDHISHGNGLVVPSMQAHHLLRYLQAAAFIDKSLTPLLAVRPSTRTRNP
jgi:hypothetical protein